MSENQLSVIDRTKYEALIPDSAAARAFQVNVAEDEGGFSVSNLIRVPTPTGGLTKWSFNGPSGEEVLTEIEGIVCFQKVYGVLWEGEDPKKGVPPIMSTVDLKVGRLMRPIEQIPQDILDSIAPFEIGDGLYDWKKIPQTQMGTGRRGFGKAAKEGYSLFLLRPDGVLPLFIRVGPGSSNNFRRMLYNLSVEYWRACIGLTLLKVPSKGGVDYSQIQFTVKGVCDEETGAFIDRMYRQPIKTSYESGAIDVTDVDDETIED